jgi:hypothetical protein
MGDLISSGLTTVGRRFPLLGWIAALAVASSWSACGRPGGRPLPSDDLPPPAAGPGVGSAVDGGPACLPAVEVLAEGERYPYQPVVGTTRLSWITPDGIRSMPLAGGSPTTLWASASVRAIAGQGDDVYFADHGSRNIGWIRGSAPELIAAINASALTVSGDHLYFAEESPDNTIEIGAGEGQVGRIPLAGGDVEVLASGLESPIALAVSGEAVVFASGTGGVGVLRLDLGGGAIDAVGGDFVSSLAADDREVCFVTHETLPAELVCVPASGAPRTVAGGLRQFAALAMDASGFYLFSDSGRLSRLPRDGGEAVTLTADLGRDQLGPIALDDTSVYLALPTSGQLVRVSRTADTDPPSARCGTGGTDGECPAPVGDPEAIAATPRADEDLERLALKLDGTLVATQATYDRLVADAAAMRGALPDGVTIRYHAFDDGRTLFLALTEPAGQAMQAGTYTAWDCLSDFYGLRDVLVHHSEVTDEWSAVVTLEGLYDVDQLTGLYAQLPGVLAAQVDGGLGDGPTLCAARSGQTYEYVVDDRGGDCPAGCTETTAYHFVSTAPGVVERLETWQSGPEAGIAPAPDWYSLCRGF